MANRFFQSWANRRRNPFTDQETPVEKQETGLIIPTSAPYLVQLLEVPLKELPSSVTVYNVTDSQYMTEVATSPAQGQFRVDYPEPNGEGTGLIEFNSADAGKVINVSYKGTGSPVITEFLDAIVAEYSPATSGIVSSDTDRNYNDTEKSIEAGSWTKIKEITINENVYGSLKVYWGFHSEEAQVEVQTILYLNGVAVSGTPHLCSTTVWTPASEVIPARQFSPGDKIQIYAKYTSTPALCYVRNMRLKYDPAITKIGSFILSTPLAVVGEYVIGTVNSDPF